MIPTKAGGGSTTFKFQSDSINTLAVYIFVAFANFFKFQSDSINTAYQKAEVLSKDGL